MPLDIGLSELIIVFMVVLLVFGPGKIPELARGLGGFMGDLRRTATEFTRELTGELGEQRERPAGYGAQGVCPRCGRLNPVESRFCGQCGASVASAGEP